MQRNELIRVTSRQAQPDVDNRGYYYLNIKKKKKGKTWIAATISGLMEK